MTVSGSKWDGRMLSVRKAEIAIDRPLKFFMRWAASCRAAICNTARSFVAWNSLTGLFMPRWSREGV